MDRLEEIRYLIDILLSEMPQYAAQAARASEDLSSQRRLLRGLMNLRPPMPLQEKFLEAQDRLLQAEQKERGVIHPEDLPAIAGCSRLILWQGDITRLAADAIVNAANSALLGCFVPCHGCIDNAIHSFAGLQLRDACSRLMNEQGFPEPAGRAKLTAGYNLPAAYVLHTVGPIVDGALRREESEQLASCYRSCLMLAARHNLRSVAFCCISTGEFHFPNEKAAEIAVATVKEFLRQTGGGMKVIFNVFKDRDYALYRALLGPDSASAAGAHQG